MAKRSTKSGIKFNGLKTFTYYIPAPGPRKTGYREREFDKIMQGIFHSGFELVEFQTQSVGGEQGGLFIIALLKAPNKKISELDMELDLQEKFKLSHAHSSPDITLENDEED